MPSLDQDPSASVLDAPVSTATAQALNELGFLLGVSSLNFSCQPVVRNALLCLRQTKSDLPLAAPLIEDIAQQLQKSIEELAEMDLVTPDRAPGFLPPNLPALTLVSRMSLHTAPEVMQSAGNMLLGAYLTGLPMPKARCERLHQIASATRREPSLSAQTQVQMEKLQSRTQRDLIETLQQHARVKNKDILRLNSRLINHLRTYLYSDNEDQQRCANPRAFLEGEELQKTLNHFKQLMTEGDAHALLVMVSFCLHLPLDLVQTIPLWHGQEGGGRLLWLDPATGLVHLSLKPLLSELGRQIDGSLPVGHTLRMTLPDIVGMCLRDAVNLTPTAEQLSDLRPRSSRDASRLDDEYTVSKITKLIRSTPALALRLTTSRPIVSYAFLSFFLLNKSDVPYLTVSEDRIWDIRARVFESLDLRTRRIIPDLKPQHLGSARTPCADTIQSIFEEADATVSATAVGRRYTLQNLIQYHNHYARRVGLFLQLTSGARASQTIDFLASTWFAGALFGYVNDKAVGASGGQTPVPISMLMTEQLRLWSCHLRSLQIRLRKQLGVRAKPTLNWIAMITAREPVQLLFRLDEKAQILAMTSRDLFCGRAAGVNQDFGRHLVASHLDSTGHALSDVHLFLRHQGGGINPQSSISIDRPTDRLHRVSLGIDSLLRGLQIDPLVGLAKGNE